MAQRTFVNGSTLVEDRYGNLVDMVSTIVERWSLLGFVWRLTTGYITLANANDYATINFKTPATGRVYYNFSQVDKTGGEVVGELIEGGTYVGGTAITARNRYRDIVDTTCALTSLLTGNSASSGTVSGGISIYPGLVPGSSQGNSKPAGNAQSAGMVILKKNTNYTIKLTVLAATTMLASVDVAYIAVAD